MRKSIIPVLIFGLFFGVGVVFCIPGIIMLILGLIDSETTGIYAGLGFLLFGLIYSLIGGIGLFVLYNRKKKYRTLKENGVRISANYVETIVNETVHIQYRHPYNIICEWNNPADGKKYIFKSGNIWFNPENIIKENCISRFDVYYDENNIKRYVVDIDCLTKNVVDLS